MGRRELREVVFVDGVRTAFGRAGPKGIFWRTRADDMAVKVVRELIRRNPEIPVDLIVNPKVGLLGAAEAALRLVESH